MFKQVAAATPCVGGDAGGYPCNNVDLLAFVPLANIGGGNGNDVWGWTDPLTAKEYALMGLSNGTAFVDISDPENPVYLGILPSHTGSSTWRDMKTFSDHVFVVSDGNGSHGMQVFDLTTLRTVTSPPVTFSETSHFPDFGSAHNIVINEDTGYAYAVGTDTCSGGLHMIDISSPTAPVDAGCFSADGYTHDAQCVVYNGPDATHQGSEICFNANEDTVTIVDVTNKAAPVQLSRSGYSGSAYAHQGWLTEDHVHYLMNDELDESNFGHNTRTRVWDVSDLDAPVLIGYDDGETTAIDHNLYTHNGYVFEANYRAGLRILDLADVANANLPEVAYFDIYPSSNSPSFSGAWSTYPFFDSGIVLISGMGSGLFIVRPTSLNADFSINAVETGVSVCDPGSGTSDIELTSLAGYSGAVTLSATGFPALTSYSFTPPVVNLPGTTSSLLQVNTAGAVPGTYPLTVTGDDGVTSHNTGLDLDIVSGTPTAPVGTSPANGQLIDSVMPELAWMPLINTASALLEIDDDPAFASVDYSSAVAGTGHTVASPLAPSTTYSWRITAFNACGSTTSSVRTFVTPNIICADYASSDVPKVIPEGGGTSGSTTSTLTVPLASAVFSVEVSLAGIHTYMGDLLFSLQSPDGTSVVVLDTASCNSADDFAVTLDDTAPSPPPCPPTDGLSHLPSNPLAGFSGDSAGGTWTLTIVDNFEGDIGELQFWSLRVCADESPAPDALVFKDGFEGGDTSAWSSSMQ